MKTIYLIRHAESFANTGGISLPDRHIPLSEWGYDQAADLVRVLPPTRHVYTSPLRRTRETAAPYCMVHRVVPQVLTSLSEFSYLSMDLIAGMNGEQRRPLTQAYWTRADIHERTGHDVETFAEFVQRVADFRERAATLPDQSICFTHGIWIAMLMWQLQGGTLNDMTAFRTWQQNLPIPNASIWQFDGKKIVQAALS